MRRVQRRVSTRHALPRGVGRAGAAGYKLVQCDMGIYHLGALPMQRRYAGYTPCMMRK